MKKLLKQLITLFTILVILSFSCKKKNTTGGTVPPPQPQPQPSTALIYTGTNGKLSYNKFANEGETENINTIPDFSNAGYKGGGVALPEIPVKKTLNPITGDNLAQIQAAIDEVENLPADANGFRGAVLLKAGNYEVSNTLFIEQSGVVLRGEGQSSSGTVLKATRKAQHSLIEIRGTGTGIPEVTGTRKKITTP